MLEEMNCNTLEKANLERACLKKKVAMIAKKEGLVDLEIHFVHLKAEKPFSMNTNEPLLP